MCLINAVEVLPAKYNVLVVHVNIEIRREICTAIHADSALTVWGEAASVREACNLLEYGLPAVALIDRGLPDCRGETIISWLHKNAPYVEILVLAKRDDSHNVDMATKSGAPGNLHQYEAPENISTRIKLALKDRAAIFQNTTRLNGCNDVNVGTGESQPDSIGKKRGGEKSKLTPTEIDILKYVAKGFTGPEIADITGRSVNTVPVHMKSIYRKLSASGRGEAVFRALQLGLIGRD